ncbi:MAG: hypothetical protein RLZZ609_2399 [Cyanobacteriota bacterium]
MVHIVTRLLGGSITTQLAMAQSLALRFPMLPIVFQSKLAKPIVAVNRRRALSRASNRPGSPSETSVPFLLGEVHP